MNCLLKIVFFVLTFASLAQAASGECTPQNFKFKIRKNAEVTTRFYSALEARGAFVFIAGPEARYQGSEEYIQKLCERGFSVAAFNLKGKKVKPKDYLWAAKFVTHHILMSYPTLPVSVYGWSKGADVAVHLARQPRSRLNNVLLDSPVLSSEAKTLVSTGQVRRVKIFACSEDPRESKKTLKKLSYGAKVFVTNGEDCGHSLSTSPEVEGKLVDFIEGDFKHLDTFWKKI